ncbi:MAG: hypothetical protein WED04_04340 [Promethearchaeati archaeon SRVP18_Atabeyarchaeia-1]
MTKCLPLNILEPTEATRRMLKQTTIVFLCIVRAAQTQDTSGTYKMGQLPWGSASVSKVNNKVTSQVVA